MRSVLLAATILMTALMLRPLEAQAATHGSLQALPPAANEMRLVEPAACVRRRVCGPRGCVWRTVCGRRRW
jgi:hypothetical protein